MKATSFAYQASSLHWAASVFACLAALLICLQGENFVYNFITGELFSSLAQDPYYTQHPLHFFIACQFVMGLIGLCIFGLVYLVQKITKLPKSFAILGRRLRQGKSKISHRIGYVLIQFNDSMFEGYMNYKPYESLNGLLCMGMLALMECGRRCVTHLIMVQMADEVYKKSAQVLCHVFIAVVPILTYWILKEAWHGMQILSATFAFIGLFLIYFPNLSGAQFSQPITLSQFTTVCIAYLTAALFSSYLVLYKFFNPKGPLYIILSCQAFGAALLGSLFAIPRDFLARDWPLPDGMSSCLQILKGGAFLFCIYWAINLGLRWGQSSQVATTFLLIPVLRAPFNFSSIYAYIFAAMGFLLDLLYHFAMMSKKRHQREQRLLKANLGEDYDSTHLLLGHSQIKV